jgi:putative tricarboxylic transport membrane protein
MFGKRSSFAVWSERTFFLRNADRLSGLVLALIAAFAIYESSHLPFGAIWAPDAGFFPLSLSVLLLVIALFGISASYFGQPDSAEFFGRSSYVAIATAALIVYALALPTVGFVVATVIVLLLMMRGFGGMSWSRAFLISLSTVLVTYIGFRKLGVPLPHGILPF